MKRKHTQNAMIQLPTYYIYADKGTLLATYSRQECTPNTVYLDEHTLYGCKRLGVRNYPQPGRNVNSADYKFGYNGKEKDDEE